MLNQQFIKDAVLIAAWQCICVFLAPDVGGDGVVSPVLKAERSTCSTRAMSQARSL